VKILSPNSPLSLSISTYFYISEVLVKPLDNELGILVISAIILSYNSVNAFSIDSGTAFPIL